MVGSKHLLSQIEQLQHLVNVGIALSAERNLQTLPHLILKEARGFTNSQAGTLYIVSDDELQFSVVQNDVVTVSERYETGHQEAFEKALPLTTASLAGYVAVTGEPLHVQDVYNLSTAAQYHFDDRFDRVTGFKTQTTLLVPIKDREDVVLGVLQVTNPLDGAGSIINYTTAMRELILALASQAGAALVNVRLAQNIEQLHLDIISRLALAAEFRDKETGYHLQRTSHYSQELALELGMTVRESRDILQASLLHDVGKIGIPDSILYKPGKLTSKEWVVMKQHCAIGAQILSGSSVEIVKLAEVIALSHHEKWDGSGYPGGLSNTEIPIEGRVVAVADAFDALLSKRAYKDSFTLEDTLKSIDEGIGCYFDPDVVSALHRALPRLLEIRDQWIDPEFE